MLRLVCLNSPLEEGIWIEFPQNMCADDGNYFVLLGKTVYGLQQDISGVARSRS